MNIKADLETAWRALLNKAARPDGLQSLEWRLDLADEFGVGPLLVANTGEGPGAISIAREWIAFLDRQNFEEGHSSDWDLEYDEVGHCSWKGDLAGFPIVIWCLPDPEEHYRQMALTQRAYDELNEANHMIETSRRRKADEPRN